MVGNIYRKTICLHVIILNIHHSAFNSQCVANIVLYNIIVKGCRGTENMDSRALEIAAIHSDRITCSSIVFDEVIFHVQS